MRVSSPVSGGAGRQAEAPAVQKVTSEEPQQQLSLGQESSGAGKASGAGWHGVHDSWPCGDFMSL